MLQTKIPSKVGGRQQRQKHPQKALTRPSLHGGSDSVNGLGNLESSEKESNGWAQPANMPTSEVAAQWHSDSRQRADKKTAGGCKAEGKPGPHEKKAPTGKANGSVRA